MKILTIKQFPKFTGYREELAIAAVLQKGK